MSYKAPKIPTDTGSSIPAFVAIRKLGIRLHSSRTNGELLRTKLAHLNFCISAHVNLCIFETPLLSNWRLGPSWRANIHAGLHRQAVRNLPEKKRLALRLGILQGCRSGTEICGCYDSRFLSQRSQLWYYQCCWYCFWTTCVGHFKTLPIAWECRTKTFTSSLEACWCSHSAW